jgi:hypothetical protein
LVDLHFEVLKHPAYLSVWPIWTTTFLQTSWNTSRDESFHAFRKPH